MNVVTEWIWRRLVEERIETMQKNGKLCVRKKWMEIVISFEKSCHNVADDSDLTWNYRNHCNVDLINSIGISIDEFFIRSEIKRTEMKWIDKKSIDDRRRSVFLDFRTFGHVADTSRTDYQDVGMNRCLSRGGSSELSYIFLNYFDYFRYVRVEWIHYNVHQIQVIL